MYSTKLEAIINLFELLPETERRETLVSYADHARKQEPGLAKSLCCSRTPWTGLAAAFR